MDAPAPNYSAPECSRSTPPEITYIEPDPHELRRSHYSATENDLGREMPPLEHTIPIRRHHTRPPLPHHILPQPSTSWRIATEPAEARSEGKRELRDVVRGKNCGNPNGVPTTPLCCVKGVVCGLYQHCRAGLVQRQHCGDPDTDRDNPQWVLYVR
jgi:hypothetical protein